MSEGKGLGATANSVPARDVGKAKEIATGDDAVGGPGILRSASTQVPHSITRSTTAARLSLGAAFLPAVAGRDILGVEFQPTLDT